MDATIRFERYEIIVTFIDERYHIKALHINVFNLPCLRYGWVRIHRYKLAHVMELGATKYFRENWGHVLEAGFALEQKWINT